MPLVTTSAHWEFCPRCGKHTVLVHGDGERSSMIVSKEAAHLLVEFWFSQQRVSKEECVRLHDQVDDSNLERNLSPVDLKKKDPMVETAIRMMNACRTSMSHLQPAH